MHTREARPQGKQQIGSHFHSTEHKADLQMRMTSLRRGRKLPVWMIGAQSSFPCSPAPSLCPDGLHQSRAWPEPRVEQQPPGSQHLLLQSTAARRALCPGTHSTSYTARTSPTLAELQPKRASSFELLEHGRSLLSVGGHHSCQDTASLTSLPHVEAGLLPTGTRHRPPPPIALPEHIRAPSDPRHRLGAQGPCQGDAGSPGKPQDSGKAERGERAPPPPPAATLGPRQLRRLLWHSPALGCFGKGVGRMFAYLWDGSEK